MSSKMRSGRKIGPVQVDPSSLTATERLLFSQAVYEFGSDSWTEVSKLLTKHPLISRPKTFFTADSCRDIYIHLMNDAGLECSDANAVVHAPMHLKLAQKHYQARMLELRDLIAADEQRFKTLVKEIDEIRSGLWDDKIVSGDNVDSGDAPEDLSPSRSDLRDENSPEVQEIHEDELSVREEVVYSDSPEPVPSSSQAVDEVMVILEETSEESVQKLVDESVQHQTLPEFEELRLEERDTIVENAPSSVVAPDSVKEAMEGTSEPQESVLSPEMPDPMSEATEKEVSGEPISPEIEQEAPVMDTGKASEAPHHLTHSTSSSLASRASTDSLVSSHKERRIEEDLIMENSEDDSQSVPSDAAEQAAPSPTPEIAEVEQVTNVIDIDEDATMGENMEAEEMRSPDTEVASHREGKSRASDMDLELPRGKKRAREESEPTEQEESGGANASGGSSRRRRERQSVAGGPASTKRFQNVIGMLHSQISQHRNGAIFHNPIKNSEAPDYHEIVKRPMDLKTIKLRVRDGVTVNSLEFQRDVYLMFANAMMYNRPGADIYSMTEEMMLDSEAHINTYRQTEGYVPRG